MWSISHLLVAATISLQQFRLLVSCSSSWSAAANEFPIGPLSVSITSKTDPKCAGGTGTISTNAIGILFLFYVP
jgi:hypothetical protein